MAEHDGLGIFQGDYEKIPALLRRNVAPSESALEGDRIAWQMIRAVMKHSAWIDTSVPTSARVLITAPYFLPVVEEFRSRFARHGVAPTVIEVHERAEEGQLLDIIHDFHGVICGDDRFTARVLARARRLQVICKWGTGIDSIDQAACRRHGIMVCNTPDAFSAPVADTVLGYALAFARNITWMDRDMKAGAWRKIAGRSLAESTFGIIGVGHVGRRVAERVAAFGGQLLGCDIRPIDDAVRHRTGLQPADLRTVLAESDFVSINCDLNASSHHLINGAALAQMKASAVLINTARGPIVDETALIQALRAGALGGAALDVFENEPLPADSPLRTMGNVLLAPHNSNSSPTAWTRVHETTFANLIAGLQRD